MENKNIIYKHTLKEYNKRFRHHNNLLKFTKKEVEEFDNLAKTTGEHYVLRNYKWWLINDTYYQVPRVLHHYWFRNLNVGIQTISCLLGAGAITAAVTLPLVLNRENIPEEPIINILDSEADIDKVASHIELHKESTVVLKKKSDKEIEGVQLVKVGNNTLNTNEYSFNTNNMTLTIKAEAMTSTKIEIKVKIKEHIIEELPYYLDYEQLADNNIAIKAKGGELEAKDYPEEIKIASQYKINNEIKTVTEIAERGFHGYNFSYDNVKRITLPDTIIKINDSAFNNLNTLTYINIPSSVTEIGDRALGRDYGSFASEPKITIDIEKGSQLKTIGKCAFIKRSFESITIPASVTTIGDNCFFECQNLKSVTFENKTGWKQIGGNNIDVNNANINASNLLNCEESTSHNWGYTGITTEEAIKVNVDYDEDSFKNFNLGLSNKGTSLSIEGSLSFDVTSNYDEGIPTFFVIGKSKNTQEEVYRTYSDDIEPHATKTFTIAGNELIEYWEESYVPGDILIFSVETGFPNL